MARLDRLVGGQGRRPDRRGDRPRVRLRAARGGRRAARGSAAGRARPAGRRGPGVPARRSAERDLHLQACAGAGDRLQRAAAPAPRGDPRPHRAHHGLRLPRGHGGQSRADRRSLHPGRARRGGGRVLARGGRSRGGALRAEGGDRPSRPCAGPARALPGEPASQPHRARPADHAGRCLDRGARLCRAGGRRSLRPGAAAVPGARRRQRGASRRCSAAGSSSPRAPRWSEALAVADEMLQLARRARRRRPAADRASRADQHLVLPRRHDGRAGACRDGARHVRAGQARRAREPLLRRSLRGERVLPGAHPGADGPSRAGAALGACRARPGARAGARRDPRPCPASCLPVPPAVSRARGARPAGG